MESEIIIWNTNKDIKTKFIVMRGHIDYLPLIGRHTLIELGMMVLVPIGNIEEINKLRIKQISRINVMKSKRELIGEYKDLFEGIGNITEHKKKEKSSK